MLKEGRRISVVPMSGAWVAVVYTCKNLREPVEVFRLPGNVQAEDGTMKAHLVEVLKPGEGIFLHRVSSKRQIAFDVRRKKK